MPPLSNYARRRKIHYFLEPIPKTASILEVGCGVGWVGKFLKSQGWTRYTGLDIVPPADIVGDVRDWRNIGLSPESFDVIIAFEVLEHVDCLDAIRALLRPGGRLLATSPVPHMDWALKVLERLRLNQKRTSPHCNLLYFENIGGFRTRELRRVWRLVQWAVFTK